MTERDEPGQRSEDTPASSPPSPPPVPGPLPPTWQPPQPWPPPPPWQPPAVGSATPGIGAPQPTTAGQAPEPPAPAAVPTRPTVSSLAPPGSSANPGPLPPPAGGPWRPPKRIEPVPDTSYGLAYLDVPRPTSGPSVGAMVVGIAALLVTLLMGCFGLLATTAGTGALVGGAFGVLAALLGGAGIGLGILGTRQVRRTGVGGRGMAMAGIACGASALVLAAAILLALFVGDAVSR